MLKIWNLYLETFNLDLDVEPLSAPLKLYVEHVPGTFESVCWTFIRIF